MCWRVCFFSFLCVTFESCEAEGNVNELLITLPLATRSAHTSNLWADWLTFSLLLLLWPSFKYLRAGHTQSVIYSLLACQNKLKWLVRTAVPVFCVIKNPKAIKGIKHPELFRSSLWGTPTPEVIPASFPSDQSMCLQPVGTFTWPEQTTLKFELWVKDSHYSESPLTVWFSLMKVKNKAFIRLCMPGLVFWKD